MPVKRSIPLLLAAVSLCALTSCLVQSVCMSDADCGGHERCQPSGECIVECSPENPDTCPAGRPVCIAAEYRCVQCLETAHCVPSTARCINQACVEGMAPDFRLIDQNPRSPTFGQEVALSDFEGQVVLIYFAGLS